MKEIRLNARIRKDSGKKNSHKIRNEGEIPCVLYGHKEEPIILALPEHEFWTILHHATTEHLILSVDIEGMDGDPILTLVRDVQHHPVTGAVLHVDIQRIARGETIKVGVPITLDGNPRGVKDFGGILDHGVREIMISTTPTSIPGTLIIDVSKMMIGDSIKVSDIIVQYPDIEILDDPNVQVAHISPPKKLELAEGAEGEAGEGAEGAEGEAGESAEGGEGAKEES